MQIQTNNLYKFYLAKNKRLKLKIFLKHINNKFQFSLKIILQIITFLILHIDLTINKYLI